MKEKKISTIQSTLSTNPDLPGTFLFNSIVFGPVISRRLGASLGINLLPANRKVCSFNCIYCECGSTPATLDNNLLPSKNEVIDEIEKALIKQKKQNKTIDTITFAGNGEPTLHPEFPLIIESVIELRDKYFPNSRIAVLSNASRIHKPGILNALSMIDDPVLKIDSGIEATLKLIDCPVESFNLEAAIKIMEKMNGDFILQTMFIKGVVNNIAFDNTTEEEVSAWLKVVERIKPRLVQIYSLSRIPASSNVEKIDESVLNSISERVKKLNIETLVTP